MWFIQLLIFILIYHASLQIWEQEQILSQERKQKMEEKGKLSVTVFININ